MTWARRNADSSRFFYTGAAAFMPQSLIMQIPSRSTVADLASPERAEQMADGAVALLRQLAQRLLAGRIPFRWPSRSCWLEQTDYTLLPPPARPVLDAVEVHAKRGRNSGQRLAACQLLQRLPALPHARVRVMNSHSVQRAPLRFIQLQASHDSLVVNRSSPFDNEMSETTWQSAD